MMTEFCYKIFSQGNEVLLAISDMSILGKTFEEGDLQMSVSREFYYGKECDKKSVLKLIKGATIVNAVGKKIIEFMTHENILDKNSILVVSGIPHTQIITVKA